MAEIWLVRHGDYDHCTGLLSPKGKEQAVQAREELLAQELGNTAIILSSTTPRCLQTAKILREGLKSDTPVISSDKLMQAGLHPDPDEDISVLAKEALKNTDISLNEESKVVIVDHQLLIATATGLEPTEVKLGGVYHLTA